MINLFKNIRLLAALILMFSTPVSYGKDYAINNTHLTELNGNLVDLTQNLGKQPIYLKFWASWCQPCMKEMPHLQHTYDEFGKQVAVHAINIDLNETDQAIQQVIKSFGLNLPISKDNQGALAKELEFAGTPFHVLINQNGEIVHKGHAADEELDRKIKLLATQSAGKLPALQVKDSEGKSFNVELDQHPQQALFFTATWCDWYLEETRPAMSKACVQGQQKINQLAKQYPNVHWQILTSHMWTGEKDVQDYVKKYDISIPTLVDEKGDAFFSFNVKTMPTLILLNQDKISRTSKVSEFQQLLTETFTNTNITAQITQ